MKKARSQQPASQQASAGSDQKHSMAGIFALCLTLTFGIVVSLALLGYRLGLFTKEDANMIPLLPPDSLSLRGEEDPATVPATVPVTVPPSSVVETEPIETPTAPSTQPTQAQRTTTYTPAQPSRVELLVFDDLQVWDSETQAALFRSNYDDTAKSENEENIIAPGTSNFYGFSVKNNGNVTMDYSVSLEVDTFLGESENDLALPVEWRLLSGDGEVISDWQEYNQRSETLKESTLAVHKQESYTIEWRWLFERGENADGTDTTIGNIVEEQPIGVNATIYIYAEQTDPNEVPKTGDPFHMPLHLALMAVSICGLLLLLVMKRRNYDSGR